MKKFLTLIVVCCAWTLVSAQGISLEWGSTHAGGTPHEMEIDRNRLEKCVEISAKSALEIEASVNGKIKVIPVKLLPGHDTGFQLLRFTPPTGTQALTLKARQGVGIVANPAKEQNLFDGALAPNVLSRWSINNPDGAVSHNGKGILLQVKSANVCVFRTEASVPATLAGSPVRFELAVQSLNNQRWINLNRVIQLDSNGKVLPESVVDVRSISHLRAAGVHSRYCVDGRLHPQARKIQMELELRTPNAEFDRYGLPLTDKSVLLPKLLVTELNLRPAKTLPFPKWRDELFPEGVSRAPKDRALVLGKDNSFYYVTTPRATWTEGHEVRFARECFFPVGDGTVECFLFAKNNATTGTITLLNAANLLNDNHGNYLPVRKDLFSITYLPAEKKLILYLKDGKDKVFQREISWSLPNEKWFHCATQWSAKDGVQLFINGEKLIDAPEFSFAPIDIQHSKYPNSLMAQVLTVGAKSAHARWSGWLPPPSDNPAFSGKVDQLRVSSSARYKNNFAPSLKLPFDTDVCALFTFDRSFDGVSSGFFDFVRGDVTSQLGRCERDLKIGGKRIKFYPDIMTADADPNKSLNLLNFPDLPQTEDFHAGYRVSTKKFISKPGDVIRVNCSRAPVMDYIEYANDSNEPLCFPQLVNRGEIDARSFGDLADSLGLKDADPEARCRKLFNFFLASSDYFNTYQVDFVPGTNHPRQACYLALLMLNGYCGFECGPLNSMVAHAFAESALCPTMVTHGYGHVFEQAFYRGKNRLFDLATLSFYPSMNNTEIGALEELEFEPGAFTRLGKAANNFTRLTTRSISAAAPDWPEKVGLTVRSGERLRMYYGNDGVFNDLHIDRAFKKKIPAGSTDMTEEIHADKNSWKWPICRVPRPFPEFGTGYLAFDGKPSKHKGAFCYVEENSFCYQVNSGYPIVSGTYSAQLKNGKMAELEFSTDRGKTFRPIELDANGVCHLTYLIRARHEIIIRIKAPLFEVQRWQARTQIMSNPRVLPGKLHAGNNALTFKAVSGTASRITISYREKDRPVVIKGGVYCGTRIGFERQLMLLRPGEKAEHEVTGVGNDAVVRCGNGLRGTFINGKITVEALPGIEPRFEELTIEDHGVVKELTILVSSRARLLLADQAVGLKNAEKVDAGTERVQTCILMKNLGASARFNGKIPTGKYVIWNLTRYPAHLKENHLHRPLVAKLQGGKNMQIGSQRNWAVEYLLAQFGRAGERDRFRWDFPYGRSESFSLDRRPQAVKIDKTDHLDLQLSSSTWKSVDGVEVAALLLMPPCSWEFTGEMMRMLCGLNSVPGRIRDCESASH